MKLNPYLLRNVLCILLLAVMVGVGVYLALDVNRLAADVRYEMSLTPTPVPTMLNVMQVTPDPDAPTVTVLRTGSQGAQVEQLQGRLSALGYYTGMMDGQFGPATKEAVKLFQQQNGLGADGIAGAETLDLLYSAAALAYTAPVGE